MDRMAGYSSWDCNRTGYSRSAAKESACNTGDLGLIPGLGRCPGEGNGYPSAVFWPGESP